MTDQPRLKFLHLESALIPLKLAQLDLLSTEELLDSLLPGKRDSLKTRTDGTVMDGHHRLMILLRRKVDINLLPREIV